jgi:hypothetical protein
MSIGSISQQADQKEYNMPEVHISQQDTGVVLILAESAISRIYQLREEFIDYFAEELAVAKLKTKSYSFWSLDRETGRLLYDQSAHKQYNTTKQPYSGNPQKVKQPYSGLTTNGGYFIKEYNRSIRYGFKKSLNRMYELKKSLSFISKFSGSKIVIPIDVINLFDYYDQHNEQSVKSLDNYKKRTIREFLTKINENENDQW